MLHITKGKQKGKQQRDTSQHLWEGQTLTPAAPNAGHSQQHELSFIVAGNANGAATSEDGLVFFTKLNIILPYNPATALPDIYPKELRNLCPTISCM